MRRYRKARSSGRPSGRPRSKTPAGDPRPGSPQWAGSDHAGPSMRGGDSGHVSEPASSAPPAPLNPPGPRPLDQTELPPNTSAGMPWIDELPGLWA